MKSTGVTFAERDQNFSLYLTILKYFKILFFFLLLLNSESELIRVIKLGQVETIENRFSLELNILVIRKKY